MKNEIKDMKGIVNNFDDLYTNRAGYSINSIWGLEADGLFASFNDARSYPVTQFGNLQGGDIKYKDQPTIDTDGDGIPDTGDGQITSEDYVVIGNTIPRYTYSFNLQLNIRTLTLNCSSKGWANGMAICAMILPGPLIMVQKCSNGKKIICGKKEKRILNIPVCLFPVQII